MILVELEIENYKQFQGRHTFAPGANGVVAIIGPNGAGKTTLFEAIEWCLYQPREIRSDEIAPRSAPEARPRVRLRLASPGGPTWEVERSMRKTGASAEVRKISDEGSEVVASGSSVVTQYTSTKLIGLEHKAFVATFFTRQKELSFFGALKPTDRRREVGRLLGLETIRNAQEVIAAERTAKRNVASALQGQYEHESGTRDFDAEVRDRTERLAGVDGLIATAGVAVQQAEQEHAAVAARRAELVERREASLKLETELERQRSAIATADATIIAAKNALARLTTLEAERPELQERHSRLSALDQHVAELEATRERAQQRQSLAEQRDRSSSEVARLIGDSNRHLGAIPFPQYSPLTIATIPDGDPLPALLQVQSEAATVNSATTNTLIDSLREVQIHQAVLAREETEHQRLIDGVAMLKQKRLDLRAPGDPVEEQRRESERRDHAKALISAHTATIEGHERSLADLRLLITRPALPEGEPICTMCGRPITQHEASDIRRHAQARSGAIDADILRLRGEISTQDRLSKEAGVLYQQHLERAQLILKLDERIANSDDVIAEQARKVESARLTLAKSKSKLTRGEPVTDGEIAALRDRRTCELAIEGLVATLGQIRVSLEGRLGRASELTSELDAIGDVQFDAADLTAAQQARDGARSASERLLFIAAEAEQRPAHERAIADSEALQIDSAERAAALETRLAENPVGGFALLEIEDELAQRGQEEKRLRAQRENHLRARQSVQNEIKGIEEARERLAEVAKRADAARVEADDLSHMYDEFNAFDRFVTLRVKPQLEDMTSELVRVVTENKYESVVMDENYGIGVFDGTLGPYPIEHFSGGERDVVALAARLALSRLIGSQAANPPSFLVLDEVFGSLDRDRRANLLELLGSLAGSAESFQQLFVISHVDDVQVSSAFTEVWRVAEEADGGSRLENLGLSQIAEEF